MAYHWLRLLCVVVFLSVVSAGAVSPGSGTVLIYAQKSATGASRVGPPSPRSVLGFMPGDDRTIADWRQITDYFSRLDKASDRVQVQTIGTSTLGRTMIVAFISAPENIRNLEKYKTIQARLGDPRKAVTDIERD